MKKHTRLLSCVCAILLVVLLALSGCTSKDDVVINGVEDLKGKKIGVQRGTTGDDYATNDVENATVERFAKGADAILALKQKKVDCIVIDNEPAKAFVKNNSDLKILEETCTEEEYAIAVKKGSDLTAKLNQAIDDLKADGTLQKIIDNYIGDNVGQTPYVSPADVIRDNGTLKMGTEPGFEPYEYMDGEKVVGLDVDLAQAICDKLGMTLVIEIYEFDAILPALATSKIDVGIAGMTVDAERLKEVDFTNPYVPASQVIIVRK